MLPFAWALHALLHLASLVNRSIVRPMGSAKRSCSDGGTRSQYQAAPRIDPQGCSEYRGGLRLTALGLELDVAECGC